MSVFSAIMLAEGAFALFHENPTSLLPISHAADHKTV
jgi:hypothetical protein